MTTSKANEILKRELSSERWYFQLRGYKIWFIEELRFTYNRVFYCTNPDGKVSGEVLDFQVRQAVSFVKSRRKPENSAQFDKRLKTLSGYEEDDKDTERKLDESEI